MDVIFCCSSKLIVVANSNEIVGGIYVATAAFKVDSGPQLVTLTSRMLVKELQPKSKVIATSNNIAHQRRGQTRGRATNQRRTKVLWFPAMSGNRT